MTGLQDSSDGRVEGKLSAESAASRRDARGGARDGLECGTAERGRGAYRCGFCEVQRTQAAEGSCRARLEWQQRNASAGDLDLSETETPRGLTWRHSHPLPCLCPLQSLTLSRLYHQTSIKHLPFGIHVLQFMSQHFGKSAGRATPQPFVPRYAKVPPSTPPHRQRGPSPTRSFGKGARPHARRPRWRSTSSTAQRRGGALLAAGLWRTARAGG